MLIFRNSQLLTIFIIRSENVTIHGIHTKNSVAKYVQCMYVHRYVCKNVCWGVCKYAEVSSWQIQRIKCHKNNVNISKWHNWMRKYGISRWKNIWLCSYVHTCTYVCTDVVERCKNVGKKQKIGSTDLLMLWKKYYFFCILFFRCTLYVHISR